MLRGSIVNVNMINVYRSSAQFRVLRGQDRSKARLPGRADLRLSFFGCFLSGIGPIGVLSRASGPPGFLLYSCFAEVDHDIRAFRC